MPENTETFPEFPEKVCFFFPKILLDWANSACASAAYAFSRARFTTRFFFLRLERKKIQSKIKTILEKGNFAKKALDEADKKMKTKRKEKKWQKMAKTRKSGSGKFSLGEIDSFAMEGAWWRMILEFLDSPFSWLLPAQVNKQFGARKLNNFAYFLDSFRGRVT